MNKIPFIIFGILIVLGVTGCECNTPKKDTIEAEATLKVKELLASDYIETRWSAIYIITDVKTEQRFLVIDGGQNGDGGRAICLIPDKETKNGN